MTSRKALALVIGVSATLRLMAAASLDPLQNEAYYYLYARNLDLSFFDHPPMVGLVAAAGLQLAGWISSSLGLRLGFVALFAGSCWLMARITTRAFGPRAGVMAALALNCTVFYGLRVGTLAEPDGPLLFFWLLTLDRLMAALESPARASTWVGAGLAFGGAALSKYYAVLLPIGFLLYLVARPEHRRCLLTRGPYLAAFSALACFAPVVYWNATHGWASFAFQGSRGGGFHGFRPDTLLDALVAQLLFLTPWISFWLAVVVVRLARRGARDWGDFEWFFLSQALPALGLFLGVSTYRRIMPHWPMIGFVSLFPILGQVWVDALDARPRGFRPRLAAMAAASMLFGLVFVLHAERGLLQDKGGWILGMIAPGLDPTIDAVRWRQVAAELDRRGLLGKPNTFLFTNNWQFSSELAMAARSTTDVACYHRDSRSFTWWSRPEDWVGRDGIYIRMNEAEIEAKIYSPWFDHIEPLAPLTVFRGGAPMQQVSISKCVRQTAPFLFGYQGKEPLSRPGRGTIQAP